MSATPLNPIKATVKTINSRRFAVVGSDGKILRCPHENFPQGMQLVYTTSKKAEEAASYINTDSAKRIGRTLK